MTLQVLEEGRHHRRRPKEVKPTLGTCAGCGRENMELGDGLCQRCWDDDEAEVKRVERLQQIRTCGDLDRHWYRVGQGAHSCMCGQVPEDIFFAADCTCGKRFQVHDRECAWAIRAKRRNQWIDDHPGLSPKLHKIESWRIT